MQTWFSILLQIMYHNRQRRFETAFLAKGKPKAKRQTCEKAGLPCPE